MTHQDNFGPIPFRLLLSIISVLFAVSISIAIVLLATAAPPDGSTPATATPLTETVHTGMLEAGEQQWFTFTPAENVAEKSLRLVVTAQQENSIEFVALNVFADSQISLFDNGDISQMSIFGLGRIITQDDHPDTGERFWVGQVSAATSFYVLVNNESDFPVSYALYNDDLFIAETPAEVVAASEQTEVSKAADPALPQLGTIGNPATLADGLNRGSVPANSTYWYTFKHTDFSGQTVLKELDISMFATPDDGNRRHHINFELFPYREFEKWRNQELDSFANFGAGMLVSRDGDYNTAERIWHGVVLNNDTYLLAVENGTDVEIDYWLYHGDDIYNPILGDLPEPEDEPLYAPGASPKSAMPLKLGLNKDGLEPGEEAWYSFSITDFDEESFEEMALTMIATPDDGNLIRQMTFDVFTTDGAANWSPGDNTRIHNVGAGSVVYRDDNPVTGERFWQGWVVDNDQYLVQIRNGTNIHMDYWLYTGDVYRPELGKPTVPEVKTFAAGTAPAAAIDLAIGVNEGQLNPGEEQWYRFSRQDAAKGTSVETIFTMLFTPDDGNRVRNVNINLFEANQLRDWAPDNRFNLNSFGRGNVVSRDGNPETGEFVWKGHLLAGDDYYMQITNETDVVIDFHIFPEDVIHTTLGQ